MVYRRWWRKWDGQTTITLKVEEHVSYIRKKKSVSMDFVPNPFELIDKQNVLKPQP